jgi:hypothetical protein
MDEQQNIPEAITEGLPPKFDVNAEYANLPARTEEGLPTTVRLRWPTDAEWQQRKKATRVLFHQLGRNINRTEIKPDPKVDLRIYQAISLNGSAPIDGDEAGTLLDRLQKAETIDVEWEGAGARVTLNVARGKVIHTFVTVPNAKQVRKLREQSATMRSLPNNVIENRLDIDAGAKLWQQCGGASESYVSDIPSLHKDAAIRAVVQKHDDELEAAFAESEDF